MIQLAVVGCGLIGARHIETIQKNKRCNLAFVVEPDAQRAKGIDCPIVSSLEEIDGQLDGVIIATPTHLHEAQAVQAMERNWHVLIEKPVAGTLDEAQAIVNASRDTGCFVLVGHHRRHHPKVQALKEMISEGVIGDIVVVNALWGVKKPDPYFDGNWRSSAEGSPILINSVHDIDLVRYLFGEVEELVGVGHSGRRSSHRVETAAFAMRLKTGGLVTISVSDSTPGPWSFEAGTAENPNIGSTGEDMMFVSGTTGAVSFPSLTYWGGSPDWSVAPNPQKAQPVEGVPLEIQLDHFLDVIEGKTSSIADAQEGMATLQATLQMEDIARRDMN